MPFPRFHTVLISTGLFREAEPGLFPFASHGASRPPLTTPARAARSWSRRSTSDLTQMSRAREKPNSVTLRSSPRSLQGLSRHRRVCRRVCNALHNISGCEAGVGAGARKSSISLKASSVAPAAAAMQGPSEKIGSYSSAGRRLGLGGYGGNSVLGNSIRFCSSRGSACCA